MESFEFFKSRACLEHRACFRCRTELKFRQDMKTNGTDLKEDNFECPDELQIIDVNNEENRKILIAGIQGLRESCESC